MNRWLLLIFAQISLTVCLTICLPAASYAQERPVLDPQGDTACAEHPDGFSIQLQCSASSMQCLWSRVDVSLGTDSDEDHGERREIFARQMLTCSTAASGAWDRLVADGYTMVEASLPAPYGYARDERNRLFQTHFDLRRRYHVGVGDMLASDPDGSAPVSQSVHFDIGGTYERFDRRDLQRHKYRFLEGSVLVAPFEVDALVFSYDKGRVATEPNLWITTFIGDPRRIDINLDIGPGFFFGRLWYGDVEESQIALIDFAQGHLNWEILQSRNLEDYLAIRLGGGIGLRASLLDEAGAESTSEVYVYPEAALLGALRLGEKGLCQLDGEVRGRWGAEIDNRQSWWEVRGSLGLERVLIAVNDQPISLFVEPAVHWHRAPYGDRNDLRVLIGGRISFFTPAPQEPR